MNDTQTLTTFLGWCSVINLGLLCVAAAALMLMKDWMTGIHSRMLGIDRSELPAMYFQYLANYKRLVLVLNVVPYNPQEEHVPQQVEDSPVQEHGGQDGQEIPGFGDQAMVPDNLLVFALRPEEKECKDYEICADQ